MNALLTFLLDPREPLELLRLCRDKLHHRTGRASSSQSTRQSKVEVVFSTATLIKALNEPPRDHVMRPAPTFCRAPQRYQVTFGTTTKVSLSLLFQKLSVSKCLNSAGANLAVSPGLQAPSLELAIAGPPSETASPPVPDQDWFGDRGRRRLLVGPSWKLGKM